MGTFLSLRSLLISISPLCISSDDDGVTLTESFLWVRQDLQVFYQWFSTGSDFASPQKTFDNV